MLRLSLLFAVLWLCIDAYSAQAETLRARLARGPILTLGIDTPARGASLGGSGGLVFLSGRVLALAPGLEALDLILLLDTSDSTDEPFGEPVPAPPRRWWKPRTWLPAGFIFGPGRSSAGAVLEAEVRTAQSLVDRLDPRSSRVGVVVFAGDWDRTAPDARVELALTHDFRRVRQVLSMILERGPFGATNLVAGVNRALSELLGTKSAVERSRDKARRAIVIFTDGTGLRPFDENPRGGLADLTRRVARAARAGVRIDTVVFGEEAGRHSPPLQRIAEVTGGSFNEIPGAFEQQAALAALDFTQIHQVRVRNATTGQEASDVLRAPDGGFACLVPLRVGRNRIEVSARAQGGMRISQSVEVRYLEGAEGQDLPAHLVSVRTQLLESYLASLYEKRLALEAERRHRSVEVRISQDTPAAAQNPPAAPEAID